MSETDKPKREKASLAFRIVASYFWPFSGGEWYKSEHKTLKAAFKAAIRNTGRTIGKTFRIGAVFAAALAAHQIIQPTTGRLFPTAEDYMRENGIDPAYAQQLSDKEIHIRGRNLIGRIHATLDFPTAPGIVFGSYITSIQVNAFAIKGIKIGNFSTYDMMGQCNTMLLGKDVTEKELVSTFTRIPEDHLENVPVSERDVRTAVAFHEFAHCHSDNELDLPLPEADADARGVWLAAEAVDNPELIKVMMYGRAMSTTSHDHDVALYLDAKFHGRPLPTAEQMAEPTDDAFALADIYERRNAGALEGKPAYLRTALSLQAVLAEHGDLLSDMGKRRAEIYIEAVQYFVPSTQDQLRPIVLNTQSAPAPSLTQ